MNGVVVFHCRLCYLLDHPDLLTKVASICDFTQWECEEPGEPLLRGTRA